MQTKEFFLPDWKVSQPLMATPCSPTESFQSWASVRAAHPQPSGTQIWGLASLASQLIWASVFKHKAFLPEMFWSWMYWQRKWLFFFFVISLRNQMKPESVRGWIWSFQRSLAKCWLSWDCILCLFFKRSWVSYHSALLVNSWWHRSV